MYAESLGFTDGKFIGSDQGIKLGCTDGKVIGTILENVYRIILMLAVGT